MNTTTEHTEHKDILLVIDDVPDNVRILLKFLAGAGFKVLVAQNGEQGIRTANYAHPDLILLDVMMPGIDGFQVCQLLKAQDHTKNIPIIFMTAMTDIVDKVKGFQVGAADYITKPLQSEEVLARVNAHLNLYKLQKQLHVQNQQLQKEIEIREAIEASLQQTTNLLAKRTVLLQKRTYELERRNEELDAFAHTVAHDLKNPLSGIISFSDMLKTANGVPDAKWMEKLNWVSIAGRQMLSIINSLLLLAGVSKQTTVQIEPLSMSHIVQQVVEQRLAFMLAEYHGEIQLPDSWPTAYGYAPWVEEIWANYLSNGLKYGGKPPRLQLGADMVHLTAEQNDDGNFVRFWVRDNGAGLMPEMQEKLFMPFTRLHKTRVEGHGLGLSIVQQIAEKLGGKVGFESQVGHGCTFYFTLPTSPKTKLF